MGTRLGGSVDCDSCLRLPYQRLTCRRFGLCWLRNRKVSTIFPGSIGILNCLARKDSRQLEAPVCPGIKTGTVLDLADAELAGQEIQNRLLSNRNAPSRTQTPRKVPRIAFTITTLCSRGSSQSISEQ